MEIDKNLLPHTVIESLDLNISIEELNELSKDLTLPPQIENFHPERRKEFILGRVCAARAMEKLTGDARLGHFLPIGEAKEPLWPRGLVGSITHNRSQVICAISNQLKGIGIDLEERGRLKENVSKKILHADDLETHDLFEVQDLHTLIFSGKESLYKTLHPIVGKYFGFFSAAVTSVGDHTFIIELLEKLSENYSPASECLFQGVYQMDESSIFTAIELH